MGLKTHGLHLKGERVNLRPMTENDWSIMMKWKTDPEVLYWADWLLRRSDGLR
jgi:hypothetical protein